MGGLRIEKLTSGKMHKIKERRNTIQGKKKAHKIKYHHLVPSLSQIVVARSERGIFSSFLSPVQQAFQTLLIISLYHSRQQSNQIVENKGFVQCKWRYCVFSKVILSISTTLLAKFNNMYWGGSWVWQCKWSNAYGAKWECRITLLITCLFICFLRTLSINTCLIFKDCCVQIERKHYILKYKPAKGNYFNNVRSSCNMILLFYF